MLISAIQQCRSTKIKYLSPPCGASLPSPIPLSRSSQSSSLGFLSYRATSHQLSVLHTVKMYMSMLLSPSVRLFPSSTVSTSVHKSSLYIRVSISDWMATFILRCVFGLCCGCVWLCPTPNMWTQIYWMSTMFNWISSLFPCCSVARLGPILCNPRDCSTPGSSVLHILPESAQIHVHWVGESVMPSNHLIFCHPLLPPSIFLSIRVFSSESALHIRWPKDCFFNFSNSPSDKYSGLIPFRIDWVELLAVHSCL